MERVTNFISWENVSSGFIIIGSGLMLAIYNFLKWFFSREYKAFIEKRSKEINDLREYIENVENKLEEQLKFLDNYRDIKHALEGENKSYELAVEKLSNGLELANKLIDKYERQTKTRDS